MEKYASRTSGIFSQSLADTAPFCEKIAPGQYRLHGRIQNITRESKRYGRFYKLMRSAFGGEPYQITRGGRNDYAESSFYTYFRLNALDASDHCAEAVLCNEIHGVSEGDEVEITAKIRRDGTYMAKKMVNLTAGTAVGMGAWTIPAPMIRIFLVAALLLLGALAREIVLFFTTGAADKAVQSLLPSLLSLAIVFCLIKWIWNGIRKKIRKVTGFLK